nr:unnamed protein product [Callosobruchus chinensis]
MENQVALTRELNDIIILIGIQCVRKLLSSRKIKSRKRTIWVRNWLSRRESLGATEMREEDINGYKNHLRMLPHKSDELLSNIESSMQKQDTHLKNADQYEHA